MQPRLASNSIIADNCLGFLTLLFLLSPGSDYLELNKYLYSKDPQFIWRWGSLQAFAHARLVLCQLNYISSSVLFFSFLVGWGGGFETGFLCVKVQTVLELTL